MSSESAPDSVWLLPEPMYFAFVTNEGNFRAVIVCTRYDELAYYENRSSKYLPVTKAEYDDLERQWRERQARERG